MAATELTLDKATIFRDLGYEPHPGQLEVHQSQALRRVVACGTRWGKSRCAAMEAVTAALFPRPRTTGWIVAPTYDLADKVFREIIMIVAERLRHRIVSLRESEKLLVLRNMAGGLSEVRAKSADNPVSLLGEGLDFVIVDEAARLKAAIWEGHVSQRLIDRRGWALLISTPRGKGWFFEMFRRGQDPTDTAHESWNAPSWQNPYLPRDLIEAERERLPERVFGQEYGGQFLEGSGQVFRHVREAAIGEWRDPIPGGVYYAGLDLARYVDFTVLVIMSSEGEVVFVDRFHKLDWKLQISRIKVATDRYNRACVLVDSTGAGEPVYEAMCSENCTVEPYQFTQKSKAALIDNLALAFEKREIVLPRADLWPEGVDELESFEYSVTDSGTVRTGAPGGLHDDCVIALALAAWQVRNAPGPPTFLTLRTWDAL